MASSASWEKKIGQLFIVGFDGLSVPSEFKKVLAKYHLGGVIYFKRNVQSAGQLAELANELQFSCRSDGMPGMFISIDHEGGKVNRLVKPFTKFPGNDHIGDLNSPKIAFEFGAVLGKELKAVGINIDYAPVVDVNTNDKSPVIRNRAFSSDPDICAKMGSAVCRGIQKFGVMAVAKHFPGHGDTNEDSHFEMAKVSKSWEELEALELIPFHRAIKSRVDGIMTAHILNPKLDPDYPATLSKITIQGMLREKMRYQRIVFSDDLEMKAITKHYGADEAAVLAIQAGCDLLIYRGDNGFPEAQIAAVIRAIESKQLDAAVVEAALRRIEFAKRSYVDVAKPVDVTSVGKEIGLNEHFKLAEIITKKQLPADFDERSVG